MHESSSFMKNNVSLKPDDLLYMINRYLLCISVFLYIDVHLVPPQYLLGSYSAPDLSENVDFENQGMFTVFLRL